MSSCQQIFEQNTEVVSIGEDKTHPGSGANLKGNETKISETETDIDTWQAADESGYKFKLKLGNTKGKEAGGKQSTDKTKTDMKTNEMLASLTDPEAEIVRR